MDNQPQLVPKTGREERRIWCVLSYLGILCLLPLLGKKNDDFIQFHAKQGLVLLIAEVIVWFLNIIPVFGRILWQLASFVILYLLIMGIIKSWRGERWVMPILGEYAKNVKL